MLKVFISYSAKDSTIAKTIALALVRHNFEPWLAEEEILPGDHITEKIQRAIEESDFFLILLSENSLNSKWVLEELRTALTKGAAIPNSRIIPVRLDDSPFPPHLSDILYVDFRHGIQNGIKEIVNVISQTKEEETGKISEIVDSSKVAKELEREQIKFKGAGFFVTTFLGVITLILTGISSISSFHQTFKDRPQVYYSVNETTITAPPNTNSEHFIDVLIKNKIAPCTLQIDIVNKGDKVAKEVQAGILLPEKAIYSATIPPASPSPIWVKIKTKVEAGTSGMYYTFIFNDLIQEKPVKALLGYQNLKAVPPAEVIFDGKPAERVGLIAEAKSRSFWELFEIPIIILISGLLITLLAGFLVVLRDNPRLRDAALLIIKEMNPTLSKIADVLIKMRKG